MITKAKALSLLRASLQPYYTLDQFDKLLLSEYGYGLKQWTGELATADLLAIMPNLASVFLLVTDNWYKAKG